MDHYNSESIIYIWLLQNKINCSSNCNCFIIFDIIYASISIKSSYQWLNIN